MKCLARRLFVVASLALILVATVYAGEVTHYTSAIRIEGQGPPVRFARCNVTNIADIPIVVTIRMKNVDGSNLVFTEPEVNPGFTSSHSNNSPAEVFFARCTAEYIGQPDDIILALEVADADGNNLVRAEGVLVQSTQGKKN